MALIHSVETLGSVDGPGIRFIIFTSGCGLRCQYCHNPDTSFAPQGTERSAESLIEEIASYAPFLKASGGGVTISGGDPLFQPDFTLAVLKGCKQLGLHTCLDTSGALGALASDELLANTDLVLLDIKSGDPETYKAATGGKLAPTLEFARRLAKLGKPAWLRFVLVPGLTDAPDNIRKVAEFGMLLGNIERVEILPFHQLGKFKWQQLCIPYPLEHTPEPSPDQIEAAREIFRQAGFPEEIVK